METKRFILRNTAIPQNFKMMASEEVKGYSESGQVVKYTFNNISSPSTQINECVDTFSALVITIADIMSTPEMKPEDGKAALVFTNTEGIGEMIFACISEFVSEGDEGNWYYSFSFDPKDISGIPEKNIHNATDDEFNYSFKHDGKTYMFNFCTRYGVALNISAGLNVTPAMSISKQIILCLVKTLRNWLEDQAKEDERVELDIDGVYRTNNGVQISQEEYDRNKVVFATASVEVVKGNKVLGMNFSEEAKQVAKGDNDTFIPATGDLSES